MVQFGNRQYDLKQILLYVAGIVAFIAICLIISAAINKPVTPAETFIQRAGEALKAISVSGQAFGAYAQNYVDTRTGLENQVAGYITSGNTLLGQVQTAQQTSKTAYDSAVANGTNATSYAASAKTNSDSADTAYSNINTLVNSVVANNSNTDGVNFANALTGVQTQKTNISQLYANTTQYITNINNAYNSVSASEQTIATSLTNAYAAVNTLNSYITELLGDLQNSSEYKTLQASVLQAQNLLPELTGIRDTLPDSDSNKALIVNLISNINLAISQSSNYLTVVQNTFNQATTNAAVTINSYISQLITLFNSMLQLIGTLTATPSGSPVPFTTPVTIPSPASGQKSIIDYYNSTVDIYKNVTAQYNLTIGYYNNIINRVNDIETLTYTVTNSIGTNFNAANSGLLTAQGIMKNYFPGSTTPGVGNSFSYPVTYTPVPNITTVAPNTYTTFVPNTGGGTPEPVTGSANIMNLINSKASPTGALRAIGSSYIFFSENTASSVYNSGNNNLNIPLLVGGNEYSYYDADVNRIYIDNRLTTSLSMTQGNLSAVTQIVIGNIVFNVSYMTSSGGWFIYNVISATSS